MAAPTYTVADYVSAMQALLPRGRAWPRDPDATITKTLTGLAQAYARTTTRCGDLLVDAFPATASGLLSEWESTLGIPGTYYSLGGTTAARRSMVVFALTNPGGCSKAYFVSLAASFGITATIQEYRPFNVTGKVNELIYGRPWAFAWRVTMPAASANLSQVQKLFQIMSPAHTYVYFALI